jgi:hypothetical protein
MRAFTSCRSCEKLSNPKERSISLTKLLWSWLLFCQTESRGEGEGPEGGMSILVEEGEGVGDALLERILEECSYSQDAVGAKQLGR